MSDFALKLDPAERLSFTSKKLGEDPVSTQLKITNPTKERVAYKVKCTSNELFRIRPPIGVLKQDESSTVTITFNGGKTVPDSGRHYVAFYYIKVTDDAKKAPRAFWQEHKGDITGVKRLYVDFKKEDKKDDDKKEEKKEDEKKEEKKDEEKKDDKKDEKKDEEKKDSKKEAEKKDEKKEEKKDEKKDLKDEKKDSEQKVEEKKE